MLASNTIMPVRANVTVVSTTLTRPSDTTAYAAGDAVTDSTSAPTAITFASCARTNGGAGLIVSATCIDSASVATKAQLELWVFRGSAAPTPDNDNAVFTPTDAELLELVAVLPFNTWYVGDATAGAGGNAVSFNDIGTAGRHFICSSATSSLFGLVVVRNAYVPVSGETFTFKLRIQQYS